MFFQSGRSHRCWLSTWTLFANMEEAMLEQRITELTTQITELNRLVSRLLETLKTPETLKTSEALKTPEDLKIPNDVELRQAALRLAAQKGKKYVIELIERQFGAAQLSQIQVEDRAAALALLNKELQCFENN